MKYFIITFGCQMNSSDSERIAGVLESVGYQKAASLQQAGLVVVNACSVRQSAMNRVDGLVNKLKGKKTILTGCVLGKEKLKTKFDLFLDIKDLLFLPEMLGQKAIAKKHYLKLKPEYSSAFSACVPIMTGCNNFCSYCVVPYTRGREISRPTKDILKEIRTLVKNGYKEIWLLGQNVNSYITKDKTSFAGLLKMVDDIPGKFWIRFTSPHPKDFSDELISVMAGAKKITPYLNLPVQAGNNTVLKRMNRPYTIGRYKSLVKKIRQAFQRRKKNIALSTDVIVGFAGETKKQFADTCQLFKEIKFDMAYINRYSSRPQTAAAKMEDDVSDLEKKQREKTLNDILKDTALEKNKKFINKEVEALVQHNVNGFSTGKSEHFKTIKFKSKIEAGSFVKVKIVDASPWGLKGEEKPRLIVILGPTASGKTDLAIKLAKQFNGEIVSADSRQIYQEMDIGTAKPSRKQLAQVPHHLIDIIKPNKEFNAAVYKKLADKAIKDIQKRGKTPFLVGGTGLYIQAVVDNLSFLQVPPNKRLRNNLEKETTKRLFAIYKKLDPLGAKSIDKENRRRLIRAIEVCLVTKKPFWERREQGAPLFETLQIGVNLSKEELKKNNEIRVKKMLRQGLTEEVAGLAKKYGWKISAMQSIGYQEWLPYFKGEISKQEVSENIKTHTLQFANRQMTWFKRDKRIIWNKDYQEIKILLKDFLL